jgi:hypothetical protein
MAVSTNTPTAPEIDRTDLQHHLKNVSGGSAAELATYVVEEGKPLVTVVE